MMTKLQRIETPGYTLWVSDTAGKIGCLRLEYMPHKPHCYTRIYNSLNGNTIKLFDKEVWKGEAGFTYEIIAYQPKGNAPELDLPLLPEMVVEDEAKVIFENETKSVSFGEKGKQSPFEWFKKGYKSATKVYSEDDLKEAIAEAWNSYEDNEDNETFTQVFDRIIQSLKQNKTPKWFVAEREKVYHSNRKGITEFQDSKGFYSWKLTTTINLQ